MPMHFVTSSLHHVNTITRHYHPLATLDPTISIHYNMIISKFKEWKQLILITNKLDFNMYFLDSTTRYCFIRNWSIILSLSPIATPVHNQTSVCPVIYSNGIAIIIIANLGYWFTSYSSHYYLIVISNFNSLRDRLIVAK